VSDSPGEILFLRVPPRGLIESVGGTGWRGPTRLTAAFSANGFRGRLGERSITCFWVGLGRRVRVPGRELLERLRSGEISEIIDIGCAGALDPSLRRGDLVLSSEDMAFDSGAPVAVSRLPELLPLLHEVAVSRGVTLRSAPILTHERLIASRDERTELFDSSGCAAVQIEHAWFLQLLRSLTPAARFETIRVTHLVLITDAVPRTHGRLAAARSAWDALAGYALPGRGGGIASLRREVLSRWPGV
jgi:purine-nucleoside phosphorylase